MGSHWSTAAQCSALIGPQLYNPHLDRQRQLGEERQQLDLEVEENQSERNQKYRELRKREETMDTFLGSYTATREEELQRLASLETQVRT